MKRNNITTFAVTLLMLFAGLSCTDLSESTYDILTSDTFYQTKENVIQGFVRPFEHAYWTSNSNFQVEENSADHFMTPNRQGHWLDGQVYFRMHRHEWTIDDGGPRNAWNNNFQGIIYVNSAIADLSKLDPAKFNMKQAEMDNYIGQLRVLRAFLYTRLLNQFRNIPIETTYPSEEKKPKQVAPKVAFELIEKELKESLPFLVKKTNTGGNLGLQGQFTQAAAVSLLVRLYMNAQLWIGEDRYNEAKSYAQKIIAGEYGTYEIAKRWDAPFDWNNETCDEVIYAFTSSYGYTHFVYGNDMFWWGAPFKARYYFEFSDWGDMNPRFSLTPGLDNEGKEFPYNLGKPVRKFKKYPDDVRLKKYVNLGGSTREGMFLFGSLPYKDGDGKQVLCKADNGKYNLFLRDQCGWFEDTDTTSMKPNPSSGNLSMISDMDHADQNSGWCMIKYPIYKSTDAGKGEADYVVIRLAEIYYSLAEVEFRKGNAAEAERLLNIVRKRYYPEGSPSLYPEDGSALTEQELVDEWGREFLGEAMRRTILCRFGKFTEAWWDKKETSKEKMIFPISRTILGGNPNLKQNPGYPGI